MDIANDIFLILALFGKVCCFVPELAGMLDFNDFFIFSIPRVPSRSNHQVEKVGGYHEILIGTLNSPNDSL